MAKTDPATKPDWADKRAQHIFAFIKNAEPLAAHEYIAGYLRLTFCEGRGDGLRQGAGIVDKVFEAHKAETRS